MYSNQWISAGTDDMADMLMSGRSWSVGDAYGYMGGGPTKTVDPSWPSAYNLAGTDLPNSPGATYMVLKPADGFYHVIPWNKAWPAQQGLFVTQNVPVPTAPAAGDVSADAAQALTWANLMSDPMSAIDIVNGTQMHLTEGTIFVVGEAPAAPLSGANAAELAGLTPGVGDQVLLVSVNPVHWQRAAAPNTFPTGIVIEGNTVADPTTLVYNKPRTFDAVAPFPQITVPGIAAANMPWDEIPIEGDFHSVLNDLMLPAGGASSDQVFFVANSAMAAGGPAFFSWDGAAWVRLGGSSSGLPFGTTFPLGGVAGDTFLRTDLGQMFTFRNNLWSPPSQGRGPDRGG